jgi:membrane-associated progesterone receptor component
MPRTVFQIVTLVVAVLSIVAALLAQSGTFDRSDFALRDYGSVVLSAIHVASCPLKLAGQLLSLQWPPTCQSRIQKVNPEQVVETAMTQPDTQPPPPPPLASAPELTFDTNDLAAFDGRYSILNPAKLIYLSVGGIVFDVTAGKRFYGPEEHYSCFAARPCTRALCSGSLEEADMNDDVEDFSETQMKEVFSQVEFYTKKYIRVGVLRDRQLFVDLGIK